jgi:DNA-binding CsgD family transcriptional regulator
MNVQTSVQSSGPTEFFDTSAHRSTECVQANFDQGRRAAALNDIMVSIYSGPLEPEADWHPCLRALQSHFDADHAVMVLLDEGDASPVRRVTIGSNFPVGECARLYTDVWQVEDPLRIARADVPFDAAQLLGAPYWNECPFRRDFLGAMGLSDVIGINVRLSGQASFHLRLCRLSGRQGFQAEDLEAIGLLVPHIRRSYEIRDRMHGRETVGRLLGAAIDKLMFGIILVDAAERVVNTNRIADRVLARRDLLQVRDHRLCACAIEPTKQLQRMISTAIAARRTGASVSLSLSIEDADRQMSFGVLVRSLEADRDTVAAGDPACAIMFRDPGESDDLSVDAVRRLFSLTQAESTLGVLLAKGMTIDDAARTLGLSRNTLRTQLKSLFWKTGSARQTDFVRLLLRSVAVLC